MQLWTYHPPGFRIDLPGLAIDPLQSPYWNEPLTPLYKEAWAKLRDTLGTEQFIWCCTASGCWSPNEFRPVDEWVLNVPDSQILAFIKEPGWDDILKGKGNDWGKVFVEEKAVKPDPNISALVPIPLLPTWGAKCRGRLVNPLWRQEAEFLRTRDLAMQRRYVNMYRGYAADPKSIDIARKMDAERADYLEEFLELKPA
jgi:hypothetical protein